MLRDAMLRAIGDWHPAARTLVARVDLDSLFVIPFGFPEPAPPWEPSRVTMEHDRQFGGGALTDRDSHASAPAGPGNDHA